MKKAVVLFLFTVVCWVLAVVLLVAFVKTIQGQSNGDLAVIDAPGSAFFMIEEAGPVSLWHNFEDFQGGRTVSHDPQLPGGFGFELKPLGGGTPVPFTVSKFDTKYQTPSVSKQSLGTFMVPSPGDYELTVTAPPGEKRVISLSERQPMEGMGKMMGFVGGAVLLGLVGFVTLVLGIVFIIAKPKSPPSIPSHAS